MDRFCVAVALCLAGLAVSGCRNQAGETLSATSGKVTFGGELVTEGDVTFVPSGEGVLAQAKINSDGTYDLTRSSGTGLSRGEYKVSVTPPLIKLPDTATSPGGEALKEVKNIPAKYRNPNTSGLSLTVVDAVTTFDIQMKP